MEGVSCQAQVSVVVFDLTSLVLPLSTPYLTVLSTRIDRPHPYPSISLIFLLLHPTFFFSHEAATLHSSVSMNWSC